MGRHLLLLDFDGTITQHDTLDSLVSLAIAASRPEANKHDDDDRTSALTALWEEIVRDYVAAHARHVAAYSPTAEERTTLGLELAFLESLKSVEAASADRVSRAGFFRGLDGNGLEELGRRAVTLGTATHGSRWGDDGGDEDGKGSGGKGAARAREGLAKFVERMGGEEGMWDLAVVSVNWSGRFIKGVLEGSCRAGDKVRRIVANGISWPDGSIQGPDDLGGEPLATAGDKLRAMRSLREGWKEQKVVYFGDSTTDLPCLIEANLGVIMADDVESKLLKTLRRIGFEAPHVGEAGPENSLIWARDFDEVLRSGVMERILV
jgi:2-hydroxy-3-keto-5-methylthiopentenyl-1-phosphate phosphatase